MYDIIIIGAGTAGMTSAVYALRNNKTVLILESTSIGGQIAFSPKVENYPTYKEISGSDFSDKLFEQVLALGAEFELECVKAIVKTDNVFYVSTDENEYQAKSIIIATGVKQKRIGVPNEDALLGKGVYYCAICDGAFYKDREVALVGDGNTALQYALLLSNICSKVYMLTWFDKFFGDTSLVTALRQRENIIVMPETQIDDFVGKDHLTGVKYTRKKDGSQTILTVPAIFVAIGQIPDNKCFEPLVELDKDGYLITNENMATKTEGIFAAGDCRKKTIRQLTTATGDGAIAAMSAVSYLDMLK